jgi:hypothetical protein
VEVKAAWKVLSDAERHSGRFHTIQALLGGAKTPVTVGLVGFHVFVVNGAQGAWATFAQMDNAPSGTPATSGTFNFFNPKCKLPGSDKPCPVNVQDANPGQVLQVTPDSNAATKLNTYMHYILQKDNAKDTLAILQSDRRAVGFGSEGDFGFEGAGDGAAAAAEWHAQYSGR